MRLTRRAKHLTEKAKELLERAAINAPPRVITASSLTYPVSQSEAEESAELWAILKAAGFDARMEVTSNAGRLDLVVLTRPRIPR